MRFFISIFVFLAPLAPIYSFGESLETFSPFVETEAEEKDTAYDDEDTNKPKIEIFIQLINDTPVVTGHKYRGKFYPAHSSQYTSEENGLSELREYALNEDVEPIQIAIHTQQAQDTHYPVASVEEKPAHEEEYGWNEDESYNTAFGLHPLKVINVSVE